MFGLYQLLREAGLKMLTTLLCVYQLVAKSVFLLLSAEQDVHKGLLEHFCRKTASLVVKQ